MTSRRFIDADIAENTGLYPRAQGTPDPNIDFRRVPNLRVFFESMPKPDHRPL